MSRKPAISLKGFKIGPRLLWRTNRKSQMRFRFVWSQWPWMTLNGRYALLQTNTPRWSHKFEVSSPSLHELMSTNKNIRFFHVHFSIGTLCLLKSIPSTRCLQPSQLIWSTKPWHSSGKGWRPFAEELKNSDACSSSLTTPATTLLVLLPLPLLLQPAADSLLLSLVRKTAAFNNGRRSRTLHQW